jgi:PKD repeat protein
MPAFFPHFGLVRKKATTLKLKIHFLMKRNFAYSVGILLCGMLLLSQMLTAQIGQTPMGLETDCDRCRNSGMILLYGNHAGGCNYELNLDFSDQCNVTSITWEFGDGQSVTTGATHTVVHNYGAAGTYLATATLTLGTPPNTCTITVRNYINVTQCSPDNCGSCLITAPSGIFIGPPTSNPCEVGFFLSNPTIDPGCPNVSYTVNYGDGPGSYPLTGLGYFTHVYPGNGTYSLCVTETHSNGSTSCSTTYCASVTVKNCQVCAPCPITNPANLNVYIAPFNPCRVGVTVSPFNGCGDIDYSVNFGDGTVLPYTGSLLQHVYNASGPYTIVLTETHFNGLVSCTATRSYTVTMPAKCDGVTQKQQDIDPSEFALPAQLTVAPNVLKRGGTTTVSWDSQLKFEGLRLMDAQGKTMLMVNSASDASLRLDIPQTMPAGMYFLMLNDGNAGVAKLIVE